MKRDVVLAVCAAALTLALVCVLTNKDPSSARERRSEASLEERITALEETIASLSAVSSANPAAPAGSSDPAPAPGRAWTAAPVRQPPIAGAAAPERAPDPSGMEPLRRLLDRDQARGITFIDQLTAAATDIGKKRVAMRAMSVLAERPDPAIDDALNRYADTDRDADSGQLRVHAAKLLQRRGDTNALASVASDLAAKLEGTDDVQRKLQVLGLLQWAGDPGSARKLLPVLHDQSGAVRERAVLALAQFDDPTVHAALTPMLSDPDPAVQQAARSVLTKTP